MANNVHCQIISIGLHVSPFISTRCADYFLEGIRNSKFEKSFCNQSAMPRLVAVSFIITLTMFVGALVPATSDFIFFFFFLNKKRMYLNQQIETYLRNNQ